MIRATQPIVPFSEEGLAAAVRILRAGGLVAFPTETVYGLGARADSSEAVQQIYRAKGRPAENPSIVHVHSAEGAFALAADVPKAARALAEAFWPGPLTLVVRARPGMIAPEVMAGGDTLAVRVPSHPVARALLAATDLPIAAPSANRSNAISPTTAAHVLASLGDLVPLILDGGPTGFGIESTIVDVASDPPRLLRRGSVSLAQLVALAPDVVDRGGGVTLLGERPSAPGAYARHYAPSCFVLLAPLAALRLATAETGERGARAGALTFEGSDPLSPLVRSEALPCDPALYARGLYAALHRLDAEGLDIILIEEPPDEPAWDAVRDRLTRAANPAAG